MRIAATILALILTGGIALGQVNDLSKSVAGDRVVISYTDVTNSIPVADGLGGGTPSAGGTGSYSWKTLDAGTGVSIANTATSMVISATGGGGPGGDLGSLEYDGTNQLTHVSSTGLVDSVRLLFPRVVSKIVPIPDNTNLVDFSSLTWSITPDYYHAQVESLDSSNDRIGVQYLNPATLEVLLSGLSPTGQAHQLRITAFDGPDPYVAIIDDGDAQYSTVGSWTPFASGYLGDLDYTAAGTGSKTASWTCAGLSPGNYEIAITWLSGSRATDAPFRVLDGAVEVAQQDIDQNPEPTASYTIGGRPFEIVFASVLIASGTMVVELSDDANGVVIADAVRISEVF